MKLRFLGGVQTVTGSKTLITAGKHRVLIDCGLFQGLKELRRRNWSPFPVDPRTLSAVILTHAHLDHSGYLPLLVRNGFRGKVYCSAPTRDLAELILEDSARLQEEDADHANRHGYSKHHPARPLYNEDDVKRALSCFEPVPPWKWRDLPGRVRFRLSPSGHILGSTFVEVEVLGKRIAFSGDLGRAHPFLYDPPVSLEQVDYLVLESTYGDRTHHAGSGSERDLKDRLAKVVRETVDRGGQAIIPSFAVGRVQDLLFLFSLLKSEGRLPDVPIYLDSPMGVNATRIFMNYPKWHRLEAEQVDRLASIATILGSRIESGHVKSEGRPAIIIAGGGMLSGGRVLNHLEARLPEERNTILLVGFQAAGTRGRLLKEGISELKMHGQYIPVRCRVEEMGSLSAHADQSETLSWLGRLKRAPKTIYINHGEPQASDALRVKIRDTLGWECEVPHPDQEFELS